MTRRRHALVILAIGAAGACVRPGHLSSHCMLAPSRAAWTSIGVPGRIEGNVSDLQEDSPIGNLELQLEGTTRAVRTDATGAFHFDSLPDGRYVVVNRGSVYQARRDTLSLPPGEGLHGVIKLSTHRDVLRNCELYNP